MLRCVKAAFQASSTSGQWMSMVLSIQTSPGRNLPLDAPVASTRHTQIALASCFVGITSKYITAHKTIRHGNRKCHLINSDRLRFLPPALVAHNAARLPKCNKSQSYVMSSHQSHTVCIPDSDQHGMLKNGGQKPWTRFIIGTPAPASTSLEASQFHELRSPNQLP